MPPQPIICWDFDETLGYFRPLEYAYLGEPVPAGLPAPSLKPGIGELLASLDRFLHVVTTAAIADYACGVLADCGLLARFADVLGREHGMSSGEGKDYRVVGERFGIPAESLHERLVIVGNDGKRDPDLHGRPIVLVHDEQMSGQPSEPLGVVLRALAGEGDGNWSRGFERFRKRAVAAGAFSPELVIEGRVRAGIDYWGDYANDRVYPVIDRPRLLEPGTRSRGRRDG